MIHIKGIKPAIQLPDLFGRKRGLEFDVTFTEAMKYSEPDNEGADFRKLTGLSLNRWNYHVDACLIGWRHWNGKFELVPYFHFNKERDGFDNCVGKYRGYFNNEAIQSYDVGDRVTGAIQFQNGLWGVKIGGNVSVHNHDKYQKRAFRVLTWFGGTYPPSKTFNIPLKLN